MAQREQFLAYLALASVCVFWGTTYLAIRMALEAIPPLWLVSGRFLLSGGIATAVVWWRREWIPPGRDLWRSALYGVLILGVGNGALTFSELYIASGLAGLFITFSPFWMVGIEALLPGGERLHGPTLAGMLVGLAGAVLLLSPALSGDTHAQSLLTGFLILQAGMASWSFGSIAQRRLPSAGSPLAVGALHQLAAGLAFLPPALLGPPPPLLWDPRAYGALLYLVFFGSIIGYTSYSYALRHLPVALVSIHNYVNCVVAVALGWLFYREPFGMREALAMGVIFAGVAIVKRSAARR